MGNDFSAGHGLKLQNQLASAGPGHAWRIYDARKDAKAEGKPASAGGPEQRVSLWVLDKREIPDKARLEALLAKLKAGFQHLSRLKHPSILRVMSPLREDGRYLSFESEPVFASVSNLMKNYTNLPAVPHGVESFSPEPLEVKMGLFQISSAVHFIHRSANLIHLNICPEAVLVAADGSWKLAGFEFSFFSNYKPGGATSSEMFHANEFDSKANFSSATLPNLDYLAPEVVFIRRFDYASDMFSLACLIYALSAGRPLIAAQHNVLTYKQRIETLVPIDFSRVPPDCRESLQGMLSVDSGKRWDSEKVQASPFFGDILLRSLMFADTLANKDAPLKAKFFKGLQRLVPKYSHRLLKLRLLPPLLRELRFAEQVPFILPSVFQICATALTDREFRETVLASVLPLFNKDGPNSVQISISLLEHMEFFIHKSPESVIGSHVIPLLCWSMNCGDAALQDIAIRQVPVLGSKIPYSALISTILPRMIKISVSNSSQVSPHARINSLICLGKLFVSKVIDQKVLAERVLPALEQSLVTQCTPDIFNANVKVYLAISKKLDEELVARKVLPTLIPLLADPILERDLFEKLSDLVHDLVAKIKAWRLSVYATAEQLEREISSTLSETDEMSRLSALVNDSALAASSSGPSLPPAPATTFSTTSPKSAEEIQYEYVKKREEVFKQKQLVEAKLADKHSQLQATVGSIQGPRPAALAPAPPAPAPVQPSSFDAWACSGDRDDPYHSSPFAAKPHVSSFPTSVGSSSSSAPKPSTQSTHGLLLPQPISATSTTTTTSFSSSSVAAQPSDSLFGKLADSPFGVSAKKPLESPFGVNSKSEQAKPSPAPTQALPPKPLLPTAPSSDFINPSAPPSSSATPPPSSTSSNSTSKFASTAPLFPAPSSAPSSGSFFSSAPAPMLTPDREHSPTFVFPSSTSAPTTTPKSSGPSSGSGGSDFFSAFATPQPTATTSFFSKSTNESASPFGAPVAKPATTSSEMSFFPSSKATTATGASPISSAPASQPSAKPQSFFDAPPAINDAALALKIDPSFVNQSFEVDGDPFDAFFN